MGFDVKGGSPDGGNSTGQVQIIGNQISGTQSSGIVLSGEGAPRVLTNFIVSGNVITDCGQTWGTGSAGIFCKGGISYVSIVDNHLVSNRMRGISVTGLKDSKTGVLTVNRSIRIVGNMCINNGIDGDSRSAGIVVSLNTDGVIVKENICENDPSIANAFQAVGIVVLPNNALTIVSDNICRNHRITDLLRS